MKRLDSPLSTHLDALVIYEQEIGDLLEFLTEHFKEVRLTAGDIEYDGLEELIDKCGPGRISELTVTAREPYLSIELKPLWARIYVASSGPLTAGIFQKCISILQRRSRIYGLTCSFRVLLPVMILHSVLTPILKVGGSTYTYLTAIFIPYAAWAFFTRLTRHSRIYLSKADSASAFWFRNKDDLIVKGTAALVGVVVGILLQRFFNLIK